MLDVVMPVRNTGAVFSLALAHLLAYGHGRVASITICDNASTDPGLAAVLARAARMPGVTVIRHERDVGVWCSVNRGLATVRTRYAMVLMADLLIGPDTVPALLDVAQQSGAAFVSPDNGVIGLPMLPQVYAPFGPTVTLAPDYNGACWLLDWERVRDAVGWYDPQFYICFGDVDLIERLRLTARETQDPTWEPRAIRGCHVTHLDGQTRRTRTADQDAAMEVEDGRRFHAKWAAAHPDIAARHPRPVFATQLAMKGAWKDALL